MIQMIMTAFCSTLCHHLGGKLIFHWLMDTKLVPFQEMAKQGN